MCGRYSLTKEVTQLSRVLGVEVPGFEPRYNIAPTQQVAVIVGTQDPAGGQFRWLRWGLIPSWAKDPAIGSRLINARSETAAEKPAFRSAVKHRRCLILADGFYEWQQQGASKQPYYIRMRDALPFAFAGLWDSWRPPEGQPIESCTILTTSANDLMRPVHARMPVILDPQTYDLWLDPTVVQSQQVTDLLGPYKRPDLVGYPVSKWVNKPSNDSARCVEPLVQFS